MPREVSVSSTHFTTFRNVKANLVIHCNVSGIPIPTITWFMEGNQINTDFVMGNTLVKNVTENVGASRAGIHYYCLATNLIGLNNSITATVRSRDIIVRYNCEFCLIQN